MTGMRTVGEVARLANITVRTLHHYDEIGLVRPGGHSAAGYRLYAEADLERLQTVLFYRELGFGLGDIRSLMTEPSFDRGAALAEQRALLGEQRHRVERMIQAVDDAIAAHTGGETMSDEAMFGVFGDVQRERQAEAQDGWGDTDAYAQSRRRTADYSAGDWEELRVESEEILRRIAEVYRTGAPSDSDPATGAVEAHRQQISRRFYDCSHEMQVGLGDLYVADPRFTATYDALEPGLAVWVRDAIRANAARAGA